MSGKSLFISIGDAIVNSAVKGVEAAMSPVMAAVDIVATGDVSTETKNALFNNIAPGVTDLIDTDTDKK